MQSILIAASYRQAVCAQHLLGTSLQVVRHIAEGMVAFLLERHDHAKPIMRSVARELLSSCVLRSIMTFFCPYTVNKACSTPLLITFFGPRGSMAGAQCCTSTLSRMQDVHHVTRG